MEARTPVTALPSKLRARKFREATIGGLLGTAAAVALFAMLGILVVLGMESLTFFKEVSFWSFIFGTTWEPLLDPKHFGVLPLVAGTFLIVIGAAALALPFGLLCAVYLAEYASVRTRDIIKPVLEVLSGIPTVVYGYFALVTVTPALKVILPQTEVFNAAAGAIVVAIMILPI
ncbi:MAG: phosphate ABC transporter permease subunit PstC, partial [Bdellovibrionales bacterium]|nr:phosphate ABC transporter permease subunit PstC [Bdellovibrionales bacterium]